MPRSRESENWSKKDYLRSVLKCLASPIWFIMELTSYYTHVSQFLTTNLAFFHCSTIVPWYGFAAVAYHTKDDNDNFFLIYVMLGFIHVYALVITTGRKSVECLKPTVQKMSHIILGLFGMILSVWVSIGSIFLIGFEIHLVISTCVFITSCIFLCFFYFIFCSALTTLYIRVPSIERPFVGVKNYVVLFSLLHLGVAVAMVYLSNDWPICLLLIASSFVFCCDFFSCIFTNSYMLCEHREYKFEMKNQPTDGIVYNVAVKRFYKSSKEIVPNGFHFDDELHVDDKWLEYDHPIAEECFWI